MIKKIIVVFLLSFFLVSCGNKNSSDEIIKVKFGSYTIELNKDYKTVLTEENLHDFDVLYTYKKYNKNLSPSIIISKYKNIYPNNHTQFIDTIKRKLSKSISGVDIYDEKHSNIDNGEIYTIIFSINDNLFENSEKNMYYGLQAYVFNDTEKKLYTISYISSNKDDVEEILEKIDNLEVNK